jgi:GNAT superfamily N-acetyltransferase
LLSAEIRPFEVGDAAKVAELLHELQPAIVYTAESVVHRQTSEPERARRRGWVASESGEIVGWATASFRWGSGPANGRLWVGVDGQRRRHGIGSLLYEQAERHLVEHGAQALVAEVHGDDAGARFLTARGFAPAKAEVMSALDPGKADVSEFASLRQQTAAAGFELKLLREVASSARELFLFYGEAGAWLPFSDAQNRVSFEEWRNEILENPLLDGDGSFVVLQHERPVALAWLLVDRERRRAEHEWTATLPELRQRGLARLAKLATIRWAAANAIAEIVTGSDRDNVAMRTLNQRLGYRELYVLEEFQRELK